MRARLVAGVLLAIAAPFAAAVETTQWPPPPEVLGKMRDLQSLIVDPNTPKEQRAAARRELEQLMKGPAARDRPGSDERKRPARAAIDPFPSVVKPPETRLPAPPTARLEVIPDASPAPPRPAVNPSTGSVVQPSTPGFAVDPRTGRVLHEVPGGFVDPRTGQFVPR